MLFNSKEIIAAASDSIKLKIGQKVDMPHPLAKNLSLRNICQAFGESIKPMQSHESEFHVMGRGWSSSDFATLFSSSTKTAIVTSYQNQSDYLSFCTEIEVPDFKELNVARLGSDISLLQISESSQIENVSAIVEPSVSGAKLSTYARTIMCSRDAIYNDSLGALKTVFSHLGQSIARLETKLVSEKLESNPNLADGNPVFGNDFLNIVSDGLSGGFSRGVELLRIQQSNDGQCANNQAHCLVVAAGLETTARQIIHELGLQLKIVVLPLLPESRWYLMANPENAPTVGVLRLSGEEHPIAVKPKKLPMQFDGLGIGVRFDTAAVMLGRVGIVRGGTV